jgi:uncharacterized protein YqgC (DUF456 family)
VESFGQVAASFGQWTGFVVWVLLLLVACTTILITLPGGWIALGLAVVYDLFYGFSAIGWQNLLIFAVLLGIAELIEAGLGTVYVAKKGATRQGLIGGFVGGMVGAAAGTGVVPVVGTILGSFAGAFGGAVLGEYYRNQQMEPSLRIGMHATIGRLLSVTAKYALALAGAVVVIRAAIPG